MTGKSIKIPWLDFVESALSELQKTYPYIGQKPELVKLMKRRTYEPDGECFEIADYVEIEIA